MIKWCGLSRPPRKKEHGEGAACKVARQFVSGIITFRCVRDAAESTRTINQIRAIWPPRGKADSDFSVCRRNVSRASSLAEGRCSMLSRRYSSLARPSRDETRMRSRQLLSDVNYDSQKRSKCCEIEGVTLTRYCQKFRKSQLRFMSRLLWDSPRPCDSRMELSI